MAKKQNAILPGTGGSGGLLGGFSNEHVTKIVFSPKLVIIFSLIIVFIIFLLFKTKFTF
jgi:hypothetical protein